MFIYSRQISINKDNRTTEEMETSNLTRCDPEIRYEG
jgi:hypothetical protein